MTSTPPRRIAMVARRFKLGEEPSDVAYWMSRPPIERLAMIEELRCDHHGWLRNHDGTDDRPRLQRVYRRVRR